MPYLARMSHSRRCRGVWVGSAVRGAAERRDPSGSQRANGRQGGRAHLDPRRLHGGEHPIRERRSGIERLRCPGRRAVRRAIVDPERVRERGAGAERGADAEPDTRSDTDACPRGRTLVGARPRPWRHLLGPDRHDRRPGPIPHRRQVRRRARYVRWYPGAIDLHQDSFAAPPGPDRIRPAAGGRP